MDIQLYQIPQCTFLHIFLQLHNITYKLIILIGHLKTFISVECLVTKNIPTNLKQATHWLHDQKPTFHFFISVIVVVHIWKGKCKTIGVIFGALAIQTRERAIVGQFDCFLSDKIAKSVRLLIEENALVMSYFFPLLKVIIQRN